MNTVKRRISFYIGIGQLDEELDDEPICDKLNLYYNKISKTLNEGDLDGWKLNFLIVLRPTNAIGIAKRVTRYPSDKEVVASLVIPIPDPEQSDYGSKGVGDPSRSRYMPLDEKNFRALDPYYEKYTNLGDYVMESSKRAINEAFKLGFSVNGKKIKFQE